MAHRDGRRALPPQLNAQPGPAATTHHLAADDEAVHFRWGPDIAPVLEIDSGDRVEIECRTGDDFQLQPGAGPDAVEALDFGRLHALTGPIAVRGAQPGDWLAVAIEAVVPGDWGFVLERPGAGLLRGHETWLRFLDIDRAAGVARFAPGIDVPLDPFLGVMGVAPAGGELRTIEPGRHGGNLDCRELTAGATLYLPVQVAGARFSCGDGHAAQGDGEVCVTAVETAVAATLRFERCRTALPLEDPLAETREGWLTLAAAPTVEEAAAQAVGAMIDLVAAATSLTPGEAYALCSVAVDVRINQLVNGAMRGVRAVLPRRVLEIPTEAVFDVHAGAARP